VARKESTDLVIFGLLDIDALAVVCCLEGCIFPKEITYFPTDRIDPWSFFGII
jgi:hypothetical protein